MKRKVVYGTAAFATIAALTVAVNSSLVSCGKKSKADNSAPVLNEGSSITVAGTLGLTSSSATALMLTDDSTPTLTDLSIYCVSFSMPPKAGTGTVDTAGKFSVTIDAAQVSIGCFILKGTEQLGTIVFKDPSKTTLSGGSKTDQRLAFSGNVDFGAISFDLDTGMAEVDVSKIKTSVKNTSSAQASAFDFTGDYKITNAGITMPDGYVGACTEAEKATNGERGCQGPEENMKLWIKRVDGKHADGTNAYGVMVWASEKNFEACGSKLGFTYEDALKNGGIDLSGSGIGSGSFTWADGWVDGWKFPGATTRYGSMRMEPAQITGTGGKVYSGNRQYFKQYHGNNGQGGQSSGVQAVPGYTFNVNSNETGCKKDGKPFDLKDWNGMTFVSNEDLGGGLRKNINTKVDTDGKTITCTMISGMFKADDTPITTGGWAMWPDDYEVLIAQGALCSSINAVTDAQKLAQLRCYSEYLGNSDAKKSASCIRRVNANWGAETAEEFMSDRTGPAKAEAEFVFEQFTFDSPTSGSFRQEERRFDGIQVGNNWIPCEIMTNMTMSFRKIDGSNDLMTEMIEETKNLSPVPACKAYYESQGGVKKSMFKFVKQ